MKKHTEKPPIDELFARKLGNMSMPPSADGFSRLQARMGHQKQDVKLVFWRNPTIQRSMAAAACLVLVSLLGWRYWPSGAVNQQNQTQLAANQSTKAVTERAKQDKQVVPGEERQSSESGLKPENTVPADADQLAGAQNHKELARPEKRSSGYQQASKKAVGPLSTSSDGAMIAQTAPVETKPQRERDVAAPVTNAPTNQPKVPVEQLADAKAVTKPAAPAERVLEVTIAEPEALVAARQAAKNAIAEKTVVAQNDKPEKETKAVGLWQQVKRIKQGEVFARQDNTADDESGLLGRAYAGLKHSLDKDKPTKQ